MNFFILLLQLLAPQDVIRIQEVVLQRSYILGYHVTQAHATEIAVTALGMARATGVGVHLTLAVIEKESKYDVKAKSIANCKGLMQVSHGTAKTIAKKLYWEKFNLYIPWENMVLGIYYLYLLIEQYSLPYALTVYNMGYQGWKRIGFKQNKYSKSVIYRAKRIKTLFKNTLYCPTLQAL